MQWLTISSGLASRGISRFILKTKMEKEGKNNQRLHSLHILLRFLFPGASNALPICSAHGRYVASIICRSVADGGSRHSNRR